jgi:methionyl aminopeptidase
VTPKRRGRRGRGDEIVLKTEEEIARMRRAGQIVALALDRLAAAAVPGVATRELDRIAEATIRSFGGVASFYKLYGYPAHICVSVDDEVVHGIPGDRELRKGQIVSFDVGATVDGMIADGAATVGVEPLTQGAQRLMRVTREALYKGIEQARPGNRVHDISAAIQQHAEAHGYSVVRKLVGHGVGREMHEPPHVPNFVDRDRAESPELRPGMTLAIEPMVNEGAWEVIQDRDGWTYRTRDRSLSAHFEHTVAITAEGCEVLTEREAPPGRVRESESSGEPAAEGGERQGAGR